MKYNFIAMIFPHNWFWDWRLALMDEFLIVRTQVVFIPAIGVAGNDLFIDGEDLLKLSLILVPLTWFSAVCDIKDC